jgi:hypothetical protein
MPLPETLLIIVGDELLGGFTTDVNGALAARRLFEAGYPVRRIEMVGDAVDDIATAVRRAIDDPSAARVIVSGGIGPTPDDRTHEAVAKALGRELEEDPAALGPGGARPDRDDGGPDARRRLGHQPDPDLCQSEDGADGGRWTDPGQPQGYGPAARHPAGGGAGGRCGDAPARASGGGRARVSRQRAARS